MFCKDKEQALDKGMELLQERQKLILLADKSQYGVEDGPRIQT